MTEEIIIDGVNVAGCEFCKPNPLYKIEYACHCRGCVQDDGLHVHLSCEHNPNCYYKQLKRLEQENKELRQQYNCYACDTCQGKEDYRNIKRHCENAIKIVHKYRSALEEIREIEKLAYYSKGIPEKPLSQCDFMLDAVNNYEQRRIKILTKINEVLQ